MSTFLLRNVNKHILVIQYILSKLEHQSSNYHKLFKIIYFADQKHLISFGRTIIKDRYIAMKDGPVPSNVYDILKIIKGNSIMSCEIDFNHYFEHTSNYNVVLKNLDINLDFLSESEIECLDQSIQENKDLNWSELREKSHDDAWKMADQNDEISILSIAQAGGASIQFLEYIDSMSQSRQLILN